MISESESEIMSDQTEQPATEQPTTSDMDDGAQKPAAKEDSKTPAITTTTTGNQENKTDDVTNPRYDRMYFHRQDVVRIVWLGHEHDGSLATVDEVKEKLLTCTTLMTKQTLELDMNHVFNISKSLDRALQRKHLAMIEDLTKQYYRATQIINTREHTVTTMNLNMGLNLLPPNDEVATLANEHMKELCKSNEEAVSKAMITKDTITKYMPIFLRKIRRETNSVIATCTIKGLCQRMNSLITVTHDDNLKNIYKKCIRDVLGRHFEQDTGTRDIDTNEPVDGFDFSLSGDEHSFVDSTRTAVTERQGNPTTDSPEKWEYVVDQLETVLNHMFPGKGLGTAIADSAIMCYENSKSYEYKIC